MPESAPNERFHRSMAARIPGPRFVLLEGRNHMLIEHDPASLRFKEEALAFLGQ